MKVLPEGTVPPAPLYMVFTAVPPYLRFHFLGFPLPTVNCSLKIFNGKFQKRAIRKF